MRSLLALLFGIYCHASLAFQGVFYLSTHPWDPISPQDQLQDFKQHANLIDVIAPRWYELSADGKLNGEVNPELLATARRYNVKVMPYIVNLGKGFDFDQKLLHAFLQNPVAKNNAINRMVSLCDQYHLYGFQLDFENIHIQDKAAYTQFVADAANTLHQHGCILSLAVMPRTSDFPANERERRAFTNWLGAYDFKKLSQSADFFSVMTYNRNGAGTTPGPNAPLAWTEQVVQYMLKNVPAQKISVGLIDFSNYWKMDDEHYKGGTRYKSTALEYSRVAVLLRKMNKKPVWDADGGCSYVIYSQRGFYDYLFIEDARAFKAKLGLMNKYHLRGFSLFRLAYEDPAIWPALAKYKSVH